MIHAISCLFGKHKPDRQRVWNDGLDFRGSCRGCRQPMIRDLHGWRLFDSEIDADTARRGKPQR